MGIASQFTVAAPPERDDAPGAPWMLLAALRYRSRHGRHCGGAGAANTKHRS
jgi:hypothetical protein